MVEIGDREPTPGYLYVVLSRPTAFEPTEAMVADILTKPIVGSQFKKLAMILLGYEYPEH